MDVYGIQIMDGKANYTMTVAQRVRDEEPHRAKKEDTYTFAKYNPNEKALQLFKDE